MFGTDDCKINPIVAELVIEWVHPSQLGALPPSPETIASWWYRMYGGGQPAWLVLEHHYSRHKGYVGSSWVEL
jgi:hypothetical protein